MSFRDNLQHLRDTRNMTQSELAMLVGVSRQSVAKWEAEKSYPEMDKLLKLCDLFECTQMCIRDSFNALHGKLGEDGTVQSLLELSLIHI